MTREKNGPWTIVERRPVYDNPWIDVVHHRVIHPSGAEGVYGTVHFKNLAVGVLALEDDGTTWLVGQHRFPLRRYSWEIPEGGGPDGEDPLAAAQRELREEVGLRASHWEKLFEMDLSNAVTDERAVAYLARGLTLGPAEPEGSEQLAVKRVPFEEVFQMTLRGEITDALSVATIYRVKLMLSGLAG